MSVPRPASCAKQRTNVIIGASFAPSPQTRENIQFAMFPSSRCRTKYGGRCRVVSGAMSRATYLTNRGIISIDHHDDDAHTHLLTHLNLWRVS